MAQGRDALFSQQQRQGPTARRRRRQSTQHHLPFCDEQPLAARQIALADIAIGRNTPVVGIVDKYRFDWLVFPLQDQNGRCYTPASRADVPQ
jgi:hypothetical protein